MDNPTNGKTIDEPTVTGARGLTKRGTTVEPEPAGSHETPPNLTGGTTTGLGRTGETETEQAKLSDEAGRETTTELDVPTELELDKTAETATGLETTDDKATGPAATELDGVATALARARLPNGAELDTTVQTATGLEQADTVDGRTDWT